MKQYKILPLDFLEDVTKQEMQEELDKHLPLYENESDIYTFDSVNNLEDALDAFMKKYTDNGCDGDYVNSSVEVAAFCDNKFLGFYALSQEIELLTCCNKID